VRWDWFVIADTGLAHAFLTEGAIPRTACGRVFNYNKSPARVDCRRCAKCVRRVAAPAQEEKP
jgi:hypothetical protein